VVVSSEAEVMVVVKAFLGGEVEGVEVGVGGEENFEGWDWLGHFDTSGGGI
jgi:hypothetical protein